ncbi:hypothetical protein [Jiangella muralis]|uniref:hypothetical protein n=1 Tax=Jiangella muralis TaxID=702383 RepID=UPI0012FC51AF|nr:hypothetical protein [Jiangella muralis]
MRAFWRDAIPDLQRAESPLIYSDFWALSQTGKTAGRLFVTDWRIMFRWFDESGGYQSGATTCPLTQLTALGRRDPGGPGEFVVGVGPLDQGKVLVLEPLRDTPEERLYCDETFRVLEQARVQVRRG